MKFNNLEQKDKNGIKQQAVEFNSKPTKKGSHASREQFKLESCQKVKPPFQDKLHHNHPIQNHENDDKQLLTFTVSQQFVFKKHTERLINLLLAVCELNGFKEGLDKAKQAINNFGNDLQNLFDKYLTQFSVFNLNRQQKEQFNKKILLYIDETIKKEFVYTQSQLKDRSTNIKQSINSHDKGYTANKSILMSPSSYEKEKNSISKIQSSFNEVNRLLEKVTQPRFARKSNLLTKNSRGHSSSFEQILERSLQQRKRQNSNSSHSKQTLYNLSRLINQ